ncbi:MAG: glucoamylase family protein [Candidatus Eisenbacteria bacterium]
MTHHPKRLWSRLVAAGLIAAALFVSACSDAAVNTATRDAGQESARITDAQRVFADTVQRRTFDFFWEQADPVTGLMPDRWPTKSFISVGATGFALTAYPIGAEHRWITREQAATRTLRTLEFLWNARQDTAYAGSTGYKGFFYHFLNPGSGTRFEDVELSNADTGLLFFGALFCQSYFDKGSSTERRIRQITDSLVARADWNWMQVRPPVLSLGWKPREGHLPYDWRGYNETMFMHVLALASTTHPLTGDTWRAWTDGYQWGRFHDQEYLGFAPLFGHQFSHVWIDFRGIQDEFMRGKGIDYFENSRRATLAQRAYAIANPSRFRDYSEDIWGLTACDGPLDGKLMLGGIEREFHTYNARGACFTNVVDDGTISPAAAGGSVAFAPEVCIPALYAMRGRYGEHVFRKYGFVDAFNPTLDVATDTHHGEVVPGVGWFDDDYLGIDQGPILAMIENWRSGLVWRVMRDNKHLKRGLSAAGFRGGWLSNGGGKK